MAFRTLSDFDVSTIALPQALPQLATAILGLILQRDRFYITLYSVVGAAALSGVLIAAYVVLRPRIGADWALTISLFGAVLAPVAVSLAVAVRITLRA